MPRCPQRLSGHLLVRRQSRQSGLDLDVALLDLMLVEVVQLERLLESEDVFGLIVALQRAFEGLGGRLATHVSHSREHLRVTFAGDDGANDLQASHAGHIADYVVQLQVHEREGLLHVLDVRGGVFQMSFANAQVGT